MARTALATLVVALGAAGPPRAHAAGDMRTGLADDRLLLKGDTSVLPLARSWAALGVDTVRIHVRWVAVAPDPLARRPPKGFDPTDPDSPGYNWAPLDVAVGALRSSGIEPILSVTGSGPLWASEQPGLANPRYRPDPRMFGQFAGAVAERYGAAIRRYVIWNEPNLPAWLQPQDRCRAGICVPESPHIYRELFRVAAGAIRARDPDAQVLFGALAPRGSDPVRRNAAVRPLAFLRAMGCVTATYHRDRTGACHGARTVRADGLAYHPHPIALPPDQAALAPDDAAMADLTRLERVLDRTTRAGIVKPVRGARFPIHLTEFGYQTDPPDRRVGVPLATQARWVQQATFLAWRDPRVKTMTQYEFQDEPLKFNTAGTDPYASWQSGLEFADGRPKPLLAAFPNPFWVDVRPGRRVARFWGQVRPGGANRVALQRRTPAGWGTLRVLGTNPSGYWTTRLALHVPGRFRFAYVLPGGPQGGALARHSATQLVQPGR